MKKIRPEPAEPALTMNKEQTVLQLQGPWTINTLPALETEVAFYQGVPGRRLIVDGSRLTSLDTAGALLLTNLLRALVNQGSEISLQGLTPDQRSLYELIAAEKEAEPPPAAETWPLPARIGRKSWLLLTLTVGFLSFIGQSMVVLFEARLARHRFRWRSLGYQIENCGFNALTIIGLLTFLIGIVAAYQGGVQLQQFGANIYITDLIGLSITREFAPLITAILVAGRTGSAFTAQLATMRVTEEIDALRVMGMEPIEVLVLPKLFALLFVMPLLTIYADIMGVLGGMLMAATMLGVRATTFLNRFPEAVSLNSYLTGIGKTPVFAIIITMVGCYQGLLATGSAENVGLRTTTSVVQAIFLIILSDALFSVLFSWMGV